MATQKKMDVRYGNKVAKINRYVSVVIDKGLPGASTCLVDLQEIHPDCFAKLIENKAIERGVRDAAPSKAIIPLPKNPKGVAVLDKHVTDEERRCKTPEGQKDLVPRITKEREANRTVYLVNRPYLPNLLNGPKVPGFQSNAVMVANANAELSERRGAFATVTRDKMYAGTWGSAHRKSGVRGLAIADLSDQEIMRARYLGRLFATVGWSQKEHSIIPSDEDEARKYFVALGGKTQAFTAAIRKADKVAGTL